MSRWDRPPRDEPENLIRLHPHYHEETRLRRFGNIMRGEGADPPVRRSERLTGRIPYDGASRREENHALWEERDPIGAIKERVTWARRLAALAAGYTKRKEGHRFQRNNFREY